MLSRGARGDIDPSWFGTGAYVNGGISARYIPWGGWWFFEAGYSIGFGSREYLAVEDSEAWSHEWAPYGRLGYRGTIGVRLLKLPPVLPSLQFGIGIEAGYGHVLTLRRASALGGDFYAAPHVLIRAGQLAVALRVLWGEELTFVNEYEESSVGNRETAYYGYELSYHFDLNP